MADDDWLPTTAFIEHYVLEEALNRDVSIKKASSIVVPRFGVQSNGPFLHRQTRLLGMLYTLLVFPRERWKREGLLEVVVERAKVDKQLSQSCSALLSPSFLRSLRNSVSHARINFVDESVTFRDGRDDEAITFEVTLTIQEAVNLLLVLGRAFHESAQIKEALENVGRGKQ